MNRHLFYLGIFIHSVLLYSIFDIYYKSPLVKGTRPHLITNGDGIAKRVVIFSADGLRSRALFENPDKSPFLHDIIRNNKGIWGISKSHVPTESRPGHVAMMAGFYEDVSAVTLGWKHNPVKFDSIFNQSRYSYMWGSPDILPMFSSELNNTRIEMYTHEEEDFASNNAANLDIWVFNKVENFINNAKNDELIKNNLYKNRQIFFLHLLGLDTNGHGYKPNSNKYLNNIATVDDGIKNMTKLFNEFFNDNLTTYIFTSDHGMTDWGSHGSGTDDEILTPFITWGSGIKNNKIKQIINQIDISPFISSLLGIAIPMNSIGILPLNFLYATPQFKYQAACSNLKQMVEQYNIRRTERELNSLPYMFKDYPGFRSSVLNKVQNQVFELKSQRRLEQAAQFCLEWIPRVRDALIYFHRYQRTTLGIAIALLFIMWNITLFIIFSRNSKSKPINSSTFIPNKKFIFILITGFMIILYQQLPITNYLYYLLPVYLISFCWNIDYFGRYNSIKDIKDVTKEDIIKYSLKYLYPIFLFGLGLIIFVSTFFERSVLSIMLLFISFLPIIHGNNLYPWNRIWTITCLILTIFPFLDTVGKTPNSILIVITPLIGAIILKFFKTKYLLNSKNELLNYLPYLLLFVTILNLISNLLEHSTLIIKIFSWLSLPISFILPLLSTNNLSERVIIWLISLFLPYSLLTLAYESIFVLIFSILLFTYVRLEFSHLSDEQFFQLEIKLNNKNVDYDIHGQYQPKEWQRAFLLIAFILLSFFGTGNIASLNSFNPTFLRNFITVFSPFTMASLLIFKISIPFILITITYSAILYLEYKIFIRLSVLLMIITDSMAMIFFFFLKDEGSWLDIGMSISNYVISMVSSAIVFLLLYLSNYLLSLKIDDLKILNKNTDNNHDV